MIGKLTGKIDSCFSDHVIINVGGVGYLVYVSAKNLHKLSAGDTHELFIETHVREDHIHLYGFLNLEEKQFFIMLQSVSGIGAKLALTILSYMSPSQIQIAVSQKDKDSFKAVSGVGAKLAERILIELKDKVMNSSLVFDKSLGSQVSGTNYNQENIVANDAISALVNLGINKNEAQNTIMKILSTNKDISLNDLITLALKSRAQI